jgi:hypothetical protein
MVGDHPQIPPLYPITDLSNFFGLVPEMAKANMAKMCRLLDDSGKLMRTLCPDEMASMERAGKVQKVRGGYELIPPPSESCASKTGITRVDMEAVAGMRNVTPTHRERLIGLGFLKA